VPPTSSFCRSSLSKDFCRTCCRRRIVIVSLVGPSRTPQTVGHHNSKGRLPHPHHRRLYFLLDLFITYAGPTAQGGFYAVLGIISIHHSKKYPETCLFFQSKHPETRSFLQCRDRRTVAVSISQLLITYFVIEALLVVPV
jgi:hypothetical protein